MSLKIIYLLCLIQLLLQCTTPAYIVKCNGVQIADNTSCRIDHHHNITPRLKRFKLESIICNGFEQHVQFQQPMDNIPRAICSTFETMQHFDISFTGIKQILPGSFTSCCPLLLLNVSHNNLEELNRGSFVGAPNLKVIDLSYNAISVINKNAFNTLSELGTIDLSHNNIQSVPSDLFYRNPKIIELNIANNYLTVLDVEFYKMLCNQKILQILNLSHNNLTSIDLKKLTCLHNLEQLRISHNDLKNFTAKEFELGFEKMNSIDISHNNWEHAKLTEVLYIFSLVGIDVVNHAQDMPKNVSITINNLNESENSLYIQDHSGRPNITANAAAPALVFIVLAIIIALILVL